MDSLEHPAVTAALRTGFAPRRAALCCRECGAAIRRTQDYYTLEGRIYCPPCVARARVERAQ